MTLGTKWTAEEYTNSQGNFRTLVHFETTHLSHTLVADLVLRTDRAQCKILFLELRALAELLGPYGIRFIQEALSIQIGYQIQEILTTVKKNRNTLR